MDGGKTVVALTVNRDKKVLVVTTYTKSAH